MLIDTESNTNAYRQMVEAIRSGSPFGFAGAGVAAGLGYPSWAQLIDRLADEVQRVRGENVVDPYGRPLRLVDIRDMRSSLVRAEILKHNLAERYSEFMRETFGPIDRNVDSVADLVALPFRHLLTSNYDPSLERAIASAGRTAHSLCLMPQEIADFVNHRREVDYARRVIHVHGRYDRPDTLVLTEADYARNYNAHEIRTFWTVIVIDETCVFFGFSFTDDDLMDGFNLRNFQRVNPQFARVRHYALVAIEDPSKEVGERMVYNVRFGVEPIFYTKQDAQFSGYSDALRQIRRDVLPLAIPAVAEPQEMQGQIPEEPIVSVQVVDEENRGLAVQRDLATLEQITERNIQLQIDGDLG
jgi:SIR2-like protein